jgi:hypothetical protein
MIITAITPAKYKISKHNIIVAEFINKIAGFRDYHEAFRKMHLSYSQ